MTVPKKIAEVERKNAVKRYEGLFILNLAGKEEGLNESVDKLKADISAAGGKIETIQKMDKKPFARVTDKKVTAGHYVNIIFEATPPVISALATKFKLAEDVYRVLFSEAPAPVVAK